MLSQLGCVTLDTQVIQAAYVGTRLSPEDRARFDAHPYAAKDLLVNIPRLEPIAWMISQQLIKGGSEDAPQVQGLPSEIVVFGAKMLKLAVAFDNLKMRGLSNDDAITQLRHKSTGFESELVDALADMKSEEARMELRKVPIATLATGMILQQDVRNRVGLLMVAKGQEVTRPLLARLENFSRAQLIDSEIMALVPV